MNTNCTRKETTDMTIFMNDFGDNDFTLSMDDVEEILFNKNNENANVPHTPESTSAMIAGLIKRDYALKRVYSPEVTKLHKVGDLYIHDLTRVDQPYCGSHSPAYVAKFGLSLPNHNSIAKPAKHADVLIEQLIKFASTMQGHFSGAIGFDAVNMFLAPYLVGKTDAEVKQLAQILIFEFAQQVTSRGGQATFSDLNLYWGVPKHYANVSAIGPGGVDTGVPYKEYSEESKRFMRALMQVYYEGDGAGRPFFFPKADCHINEESVKDDEYLNLLGKVASKMGSPYFVFDRGENPQLAQCCFDADTKVLLKYDNDIKLTRIKDVLVGRNGTIFHNGSWCKFRKVETSRCGKKMFKLRTVHGKELIATEDHLFPTLRGDLRADNITTDDYVLFNTRVLQNEPYYENGMTYEQGVFIGAFLGDGSFNGDDAVNFSLDETSYNELKPLLETAYEQFTSEKKEMSMRIDGKLFACYIGANGIRKHVETWINGRYANDKSPSLNCIKESIEFRQGIIDGWEMTDGGNSHRIYSVSKDMIDGFEAILTSLGVQCRIDISDRTDEPVIIRGEIFKRNYPLHCLRIYDTKNHRDKHDIYKIRNNSTWFKMESVEEVCYNDDLVYCVEMVNQDEPYFTMPSGWIVHNCRLRLQLDKNDVAELVEPWKLRFTALQNISINIPGIAYRNRGNENKFMDELFNIMDHAKTAHKNKLDLISNILNMGSNGPLNLLCMNNDGMEYFRYDKTKFLIGIVGLNDAVEMMTGYQMHENKDSFMYGAKILAEMQNKCKEITNDLGFTCILEQTPAETTAYRFAKFDRKRYGEGITKHLRGDISSNAVYYTNSSYMNINAPLGAIERIKMEGKLHPFIDAGAITHLWLGEHTPSEEGIASLVRKTFHNSSNAQIAFSPEFTTCNACNTTARGLIDTCPRCGSMNIEQMTRVTGYYSKVSSFNAGKVAELKDRYRVNI